MKEGIDINRLMIEKIAGALSQQDSDLLDDMIEKDAEVREKWIEMKSFAESARAKKFLSAIDADSAWLNVEEKIGFKARAKYNTRWMLAAALLVMACSFAFYFTTYRNNKSVETATKTTKSPQIKLILGDGTSLGLSDSPEDNIALKDATLHTAEGSLSFTNAETASWNTLQIPASLDYKITLSDGTVVWMNSSSSLRFPFKFKGDTREVYLQGEAYFKVAPDKKHPFIVHTNATEVKVLGTEFNINAYSAEVATSLVHGKVQTSAKGKAIELNPGMEAIYSADKGFSTRRFDAELVTAWMSGVYNFEDASLESIAKVIPRWFGVEVVFDGSSVSSQKLTGSINKKQSLNVFLDNIKATAGIHSEIKNGVLHLK